ncbi:MAG: hypothetical protein O3A63_09070 [Proteobacteria bacterium]|nr:hypothetical protein [Pseudomonadota bacterium]
MKHPAWGFSWGAGSGVVLTIVALLVMQPLALMISQEAATLSPGHWLSSNLGHSIWLFGIVLAMYVLHLRKLSILLEGKPNSRDVGKLDQLSDIWIQLFVGIGVIWTAVGMRGALQAALGSPGDALTDSAGSVLQRLVDGGILLALTTTIVGGVGGYLMRLGKTVMLGAALHDFYDVQARVDITTLIDTVCRLERKLEQCRSAQEPGRAHDRPVEAQGRFHRL